MYTLFLLVGFLINDLQNAFLNLALGDPYAAVSFDVLHFQDGGGLWAAHLFVQVKARILQLDRGRELSTKIDWR
jgi:hypothetical protein